MDIGLRLKKYREQYNISQDELALKVFVSRQTISNWENDKSYPDIKSLTMLSNIFNVSLDDLIKGDIERMRIIDNEKVRSLNIMSTIFLIEMLTLTISAYPLFKFLDTIGIIIWILLFLITLVTATLIEKFKKKNNIQTYKEIIAFVDGKTLSYDETQQEIGKRIYQKILYAVIVGIISLIICLVVIFIANKI